MAASETVLLEGHIIDSLSLPRVLDEIVERGASYEILELHLGVKHEDTSRVRLEVTADDEDILMGLIERLRQHGANPETVEDATLAAADRDGAFPPGFYSTTSLHTEVRMNGRWIAVEHPEMDCGIVVEDGVPRTISMDRVTSGMRVVMRGLGIRVTPPAKPRAAERPLFGFMASDVSSEKPKALVVDRIAEQMREVKQSGRRILWVVGPAVVHTGSAPDLSALIRGGYVNALFAGNGVATHDIEANVYGTSLGVNLAEGTPTEHGHEHHIRTINEIRRHGSFRAAADAGIFTGGIVYDLVRNDIDYLFAGSVRDDGPLPEVETDMVVAQHRLRDLIWGNEGDDLVGFCVVAGTMLHGIATGNCLPAAVPLVCVDINQATVTKLMDRGSFRSVGVITDVGLFVRQLAERLAPEQLRPVDADAGAREAAAKTRK